MKNARTWLALLCCTLFFSACQKTEMLQTQEEEELFQKEIVVSDERGENNITISISTEHEEALAEYTANSFRLIPLYETPTANNVETDDTAQESLRKTPTEKWST